MNWKYIVVICLIGICLLCSSCAAEQMAENVPVDTEEPATSADDIEDSSDTSALEEEPVLELEPTAEPTVTLAPTATPRSVLSEDDFSDVNSGWERYREFDGVLDYVEDEEHYQMVVQAEDSLWWVWRDTEWPDVTLSVDVWQAEGPEGSLYGLMCRHDVNTRGGVAFLINSQGQAGVGLMKDGFDPLPGCELARFDAVHTGLNASNTIEARCLGEKLTMWVNGEQLFDLPVEEPLGSSIGLVVSTPAGAGADARFDNFIVYEP